MIKATIDIGTNTAHLLIGVVTDERIQQVIYKKRIYTFLGEGGLVTISAKAIVRLFKALEFFSVQLTRYQCDNVQVIATEGLRAASNGTIVYNQIKEIYGWEIKIVSGDDEANLIFKGVQQAIDLSSGHFLIMDIGGGSVEFIESKNGRKGYSKSYKIGISRLYESFHKKDPVKSKDIKRMEEHLNLVLYDMWEELKIEDNNMALIGCAGTFEIFLTDIDLNDHTTTSKEIEVQNAISLLDQLKNKSISERKLVAGIPQERAQYVVVALALIDYIVRKMDTKSLIVCKYALKEGTLVHNF